jgi:hypothetical protein
MSVNSLDNISERMSIKGINGTLMPNIGNNTLTLVGCLVLSESDMHKHVFFIKSITPPLTKIIPYTQDGQVDGPLKFAFLTDNDTCIYSDGVEAAFTDDCIALI